MKRSNSKGDELKMDVDEIEIIDKKKSLMESFRF